MMNRRNILQSGLCLPFLHPINLKRRKNRLEKIADRIEEEAIKNLSAKNPIIQTLKNVKIYDDITRYKFGHSSFYGWVEVKLYGVNPYVFERYNIDVSNTGYKNLKEFIDDCRSAEYAFYYDLDFRLDEADTKIVLDILWKRAGFKGYKNES
jgi:hypothetical protein